MARVLVAVFQVEAGNIDDGSPVSPKSKLARLARKAIVYLRMPSDEQLRQNKEPQYDLAERVCALGWKQLEIIDGDLGFSAAMASVRRSQFGRVRDVRIVGGREISRLSRTDKELVSIAQA